MDAEELLVEYVRRHNAAVVEGEVARLADLFRADGEVVFHGVPVPRTRGRVAIERLFRENGPDDLLVLARAPSGTRVRARAVYGWRSRPGLIGGALQVTADGGIVRLDVVVLRDGPKPAAPREAVRALVVTPEPRVLLLSCTEPSTQAKWWITPGGGVEPGESHREAMARELAEEVGIEADPTSYPCVWFREHLFTWGANAVLQREQYFLVRLESAFTGTPRLSAAQRAAEGLQDANRWWSLEDLRSTTEDVFAPSRLPALLESLFRDGRPPVPLDAGA
jgi:8-oxo-dGTP pyrophosphatase MutT (NUDIX family)